MTSAMVNVKIDRDDPALLHDQVAAQIRRAIADLPRQTRQAFILRRIEGLSGTLKVDCAAWTVRRQPPPAGRRQVLKDPLRL